MIIGSFQSAGDGYAGQIRTLLLDAMIAIVPAKPNDAENAPGWERRSERAGSYIALQIDDPALAVPLRANLLRSTQNEDEYHLLWTRPVPREQA